MTKNIFKIWFPLVAVFFCINIYAQTPSPTISFSEKDITSSQYLNDNGYRLEAFEKLRRLINSVRFNDTFNNHLLCEAFVGLSDCYAGSFMMEKFKKASDTLLLLSNYPNADQKYKIRAYLNLVRYYNYQVIGDRARPYLDSAIILMSNKKAKQNDFNDPILLIARIGYSRNFDLYKLPFLIDSIQNKLNQKGYENKLQESNLWRVMGNAFFDKCSDSKDWKINRTNGWYEKAMYCYNKAEGVLKKYLPSNKIDLVQINNLRGLINFNCAYYKSAENEFLKSENIFASNNYSKQYYTYSYIDTYSWEIGIMDSLYKGDKLFKIKERQLKQFQTIAPYWDKWEEENRNDSLNYLRDIYVKGSNEYIVMLCYDLYQISKSHDQKFIQIAFEAQENSKYRILKKRMIQSFNLKNTIEINIDTIQQLLTPNQGIISFSDIGSYYRNFYAIVISKNKKGFLKFHTYGDSNFESILNLSYTLKDISSFKNSYYKAYNLVFKNVLPFLNATTNNLLILHSKNSSRFRFNLMISDTSGYKSFDGLPYITNRYLLTYDFSYQIAQLRKRVPNTPCLDNQLYIPNYSNSTFYTLPFFETIGSGLKKNWNFHIFNHSSATVENFQTNSKNANLLLIGAHGYTNNVTADEIKIMLDSTQETKSRNLTL